MNSEPFTFLVPQRPLDYATTERADTLFKRMRRSKKLKNEKLLQKRSEWRAIYGAARQAQSLGGVLVIKLGKRTGAHRNWTWMQVVEAAVDAKLLIEQPRAHRLAPRRFVLGPVRKKNTTTAGTAVMQSTSLRGHRGRRSSKT